VPSFQLKWNCILQSVYDVMDCFKQKSSVDGTSVFVVAAKQCCTELKTFSAKGLMSWVGIGLGQLI